MKAKRSLTSSFDQLMKRRSSRDDIGVLATTKENSLPNSSSFSKVNKKISFFKRSKYAIIITIFYTLISQAS